MKTIKKNIIAAREQWRKLPDYGCFWSSPDNEKGFRLTPTVEPGKLWVEMKVERHHSGFPGIAHGGVAFTILDGLMGWFIMAHEGRGGLTTTATTSYKGPLIVGRAYRFEVTEESSEAGAPGRLVRLVGNVFQADAPEHERRALVTMQAQFMLPNRKTAQKILGINLGILGEELFPEDA